MANHMRFLNEARSVSLVSDFDRVHIGCVVVYNNRVISSGFNNTKTDPVQAKYNRYRNMQGNKVFHLCHAEVMALKKILNMGLDSKRITVYNYRELADGSPAISRPCPACMHMIQDLGITHIVYSTNNRNGYCVERV